MDEQRLADALRGAAEETPAPSFDHADVVRASRRITARRRSALAGGAMAVLVAAGVGFVALPGGGSGGPASSAAPALGAPEPAPGAEAGARADAPADADAAPAPRQQAPGPPAAARSAAPPPLGPGDPATCANRQDPVLRAIVEEVLPEVVGAPEAPTTMECRPGGERGVAVEVSGGVLSVEYLPPGTPPRGGADGPSSTAPTASGGTVTVSYGPGAAVTAERVAEAAATLAPRL